LVQSEHRIILSSNHSSCCREEYRVGKGERETGGTFLVDRQLAARGSEVVFGILVEDEEDHLIRSE
jgi:hypothetical protein